MRTYNYVVGVSAIMTALFFGVTVYAMNDYTSEFGSCYADPVYEDAFVGQTITGARVRSVACMTGSEILKVLPAQTKIKVLAKTDGWYKIKTSDGLTGWMGSSLVKKSTSQNFSEKTTVEKPEVLKTVNMKTVAKAKWVNLLDGLSSKLNGQAVLLVKKNSNDYYSIDLDSLSEEDLLSVKEFVLKKIEKIQQVKAEKAQKAEQENEDSDSADGSILLTGTGSVGKVNLKWSLNSMTSPMGFKVVVADHENPIYPVYPGDEYHYYADPNLRTDVWSGLASGIHYFRVCEYLGGKCGKYSNNIQVTVSE